jgi:hypothetical protein
MRRPQTATTAARNPTPPSARTPPAPTPLAPAWLAQLLAVLAHGQDPADAADWLCRVLTALDDLRGSVPFEVVHHWQAGTVGPLLVRAADGHGAGGTPHREVAALHTRALAGQRIGADRWNAALRPALRQLYLGASAGEARVVAEAAAAGLAQAGRQLPGAAGPAGSHAAVRYPAIGGDAATRAFAEAAADASARALAHAYATGDPDRYAEAYPFAHLRACAGFRAGAGAREGAGYRRLAGGLALSLERYARPAG